MKNKDYPYVEPCLGCFENTLMGFSDEPGSVTFMSTGDFSLKRILRAFGRLMHGSDLLLCLFYLNSGTLELLQEMLQEEHFKSISVLYCQSDHNGLSTLNGDKCLKLVQTRINTCLVSAENDARMVTLCGNISQTTTYCLELFTLINDNEQQTAIRRALLRKFN